MKPAELEWLAKKASKAQRIAEVGSWMGRSTSAIADNMEASAVLIAVDTWRGSEEIKSYLEGRPDDYVYDIFRKNLKVHIESGRVSPLRLASVEAARELQAKG